MLLDEVALNNNNKRKENKKGYKDTHGIRRSQPTDSHCGLVYVPGHKGSKQFPLKGAIGLLVKEY